MSILPYTFKAGEKIKANEVNADLQALEQGISDLGTTLDTSINSKIATINTNLASKATKAEINNGTITGKTQATTDNSTKLATTAFVKTANNATLANVFPNYRAGVNVGTNYTAPKNGIVVFTGGSSANNPSYSTGEIAGKIVFQNYQIKGDGRAGYQRMSNGIPIAKGQVVTFEGAMELVTFYPCKGNI